MESNKITDSDTLKKDWIYYFVSSILIGSLILKLIQFTYNCIDPDINNYGFTEFLINFEGGFVRRGLTGQVLFIISKSLNISPIPLIICFCIICYIFIFLFILIKFRRKKILWWLVLTPLLCGLTHFIIRKDYLIYLVIIASFYCINYYKNINFCLVLICILSIFGIFLHEAFLFYGFPAIFLFYYQKRPKDIIKISFALILTLVCSSFIFLSKGNTLQAYKIIESWNELNVTQPLVFMQHNSIGALSWDTKQTFISHFNGNFYNSQLGYFPILIRFIKWFIIYYFILGYFYFFHYQDADLKFNFIKRFNIVYIILTICLLPMFTVLSCDWARIYQYAVMTSICYTLMMTKEMEISFINIVVFQKINNINEKLMRRFFPSKWIIILLLLFIGISPVGFSPLSAFGQSPIGSYFYFFLKFL